MVDLQTHPLYKSLCIERLIEVTNFPSFERHLVITYVLMHMRTNFS